MSLLGALSWFIVAGLLGFSLSMLAAIGIISERVGELGWCMGITGGLSSLIIGGLMALSMF